jgi:hypothetical protein
MPPWSPDKKGVGQKQAVRSKGKLLEAMPASMVFNKTWPMLIISTFTQTLAAFSFHRKLE